MARATDAAAFKHDSDSQSSESNGKNHGSQHNCFHGIFSLHFFVLGEITCCGFNKPVRRFFYEKRRQMLFFCHCNPLLRTKYHKTGGQSISTGARVVYDTHRNKRMSDGASRSRVDHVGVALSVNFKIIPVIAGCGHSLVGKRNNGLHGSFGTYGAFPQQYARAHCRVLLPLFELHRQSQP